MSLAHPIKISARECECQCELWKKNNQIDSTKNVNVTFYLGLKKYYSVIVGDVVLFSFLFCFIIIVDIKKSENIYWNCEIVI